MLTQALTAAADMYKENSRIQGILEDKAQKAAGLAGVFLAAAFTFLKKDAFDGLWLLCGWFGLLMLAAVILTMLACVLASTQVIGAQTMVTPPEPKGILRRVDLYLGSDPQGPADLSRERNIRDQIVQWNAAIDAQDRAVAFKSGWLVITQRVLVVGIAMVMASLWISLFAYGTRAREPMRAPVPDSTLKEVPRGQLP